MDDTECFECLKSSIRLLYPDAHDVPWKRDVIKIFSGWGRLNTELIAQCCIHGFILFPSMPNSTVATQETDRNHDPFKSVFGRTCIWFATRGWNLTSFPLVKDRLQKRFSINLCQKYTYKNIQNLIKSQYRDKYRRFFSRFFLREFSSLLFASSQFHNFLIGPESSLRSVMCYRLHAKNYCRFIVVWTTVGREISDRYLELVAYSL